MEAIPHWIVLLVALATVTAPAVAGVSVGLDDASPTVNEAGDVLDADEIVQRNLELTDRLTDRGVSDVEDVRAISQWQADVLGFSWTEPVPLAGYTQPSQALAELAERNGQELSAEQRANVAELDDLAPEVSQALATFVDAFLALDQATTLAFEDADLERIHEIASQHALLRSSGDLAPGTGALETLPGAAGPNPLAGTGVDLAPILSTRVQFVDAVHELEDALATHHEPASHDECSPVQLEGTFSLAFDTCDNHYEANYQLQLDVGGDDTYHNNAGGSNTEGGCASVDPGAPVPLPPVQAPATAALLDLAGSDVYGDASDRMNCGSTGAGSIGTGFLRDVEGDDAYYGGQRGANGGGFLAGVGFIQDAAGDDLYSSTQSGANGGGYLTGVGFIEDGAGDDEYRSTFFGANGGGVQGVGFLRDVAGNDDYLPADELGGSAGQSGFNGGGTLDGVGFLIDGAGDDVYTGDRWGVNGGGTMGIGHLVDLSGSDTYEASHSGTNGAASHGLGNAEPRGLLYDAQGADSYEDALIPGGSCEDCTVYPKGTDNGAQIDADDPPEPGEVPPPSPPSTPSLPVAR